MAIGNFTEQERGWQFICGFFIKYYRHTIEKTKAVVDELNIFIFKRLKQAMFLRMIAVENIKQISVLFYKNIYKKNIAGTRAIVVKK